MKIIYLHGFASTGNGTKARALGARFGDERVVAPDLPIDPRQVVALADALVRAEGGHSVLLVGTSLGGFYASYLSQRWQLPCVLVNPSMAPSQTVGRRLGPHRNLVTGAEFEVLPDFANTWARMETEVADRQDSTLVNLFLAQDDDVLPYAQTLQRIPAAVFQCVTPDGGHRYEMHWNKVMDRIAAILRQRDTR